MAEQQRQLNPKVAQLAGLAVAALAVLIGLLGFRHCGGQSDPSEAANPE